MTSDRPALSAPAMQISRNAGGHHISTALTDGSGYGAAAPASTHLLVPHKSRSMFDLVMSPREIGAPLAGLFAAPTANSTAWVARTPPCRLINPGDSRAEMIPTS